MPKIIYHDSDGVDKTFVLSREVLLVGRATECQIQTLDAMVSRRHARIFWDGGYWIEDLGSSNGVYVGSQKVDRAPFNPGDVVVCGSLVLRLEAEAGMEMGGSSPAGPVVAPPAAATVAPEPAPAPMQIPYDQPIAQQPIQSSGYAPPPSSVVAVPNPAFQPQPQPPPAAYQPPPLDRTPVPELEQGFARNVEPSQVIEVIQPPSPPQPQSHTGNLNLPPTTSPGLGDPPVSAVVSPAVSFGLSPDSLQADIERSGRLAAESEREELRRQLDSAKIKAAADHRRLIDLEKEVDRAKSSAPSGPDPLIAAELDNLQKKIVNLEAELKRADAVADELDATKAKLAKAETAEAERDELRRRVAQVAEEAAQKQRLVDDERDQLEQKVARLEESLRGQADVGQQASLLVGERDALKVELEAKKSVEAERDELRRRIAITIEEATQRTRAIEDERDRAERKVTELEGALKSTGGQAEELGQLRSRSAQLEADYKQAASERDELRHKATQGDGESAAKIRAFEQMRDDMEIKVAALESKLQAADGERSALAGKLAGLEGELQKAGGAASEASQLRAQVDELRKKIAGLEAQAGAATGSAALETELENLKIELAAARATQSERDALQQKVVAFERELRAADQVADELDRLKSTHDRTMKELDAVRAGAGNSGAADAALQDKLAAAESKVAAAQREHDELRTKLAAAEKKASEAALTGGGAGKAVDPAAHDTLTSLSDALAELRLALRTANDESTQLAEPKASVTLVTEALTQATDHLENARSQVRTLSALLGAG